MGLRVGVLGFGVWGVRVLGWFWIRGFPGVESLVESAQIGRELQVSALGLRICVSGFRVPGFGFRVFGFRVSGFGFQRSGIVSKLTNGFWG